MRVKNLLVAMACLGATASAWGQEPCTYEAAPGQQVAEPLNQAGVASPQPVTGWAPINGPTEGLVTGMNVPYPVPEDVPPIPKPWFGSAFNPQPTVEARVEAVWLRPDTARSPVVGSQTTIGKGNTVKYDEIRVDADSQFITSFRGALEYHYNEFGSLETVIQYLPGPNQVNSPPGDPDETYNFVDRFTNVPLAALHSFPTLAEGVGVNWDYSNFNFEANWLHHIIPARGMASDLTFGVGFRYFRLKEKMGLFIDDELNDLTASIDGASENSLFGPQFIARMHTKHWFHRVRSISEVKIGLMANSVTDETSFHVGGTKYGSGRYSRTEFAPLFEGNFFLEFFLTRNITLFSGVQLLYADRIDRAAEQLRTDITALGASKKEVGSMFQYGPRAGITIVY